MKFSDPTREPTVYVDLSTAELMELAIKANEGSLSDMGALTVATGSRTGRSPKDRFIVKDQETETSVAWGAVNQALSPATFDALWQRVETYLNSRTRFVANLAVGADPKYGVPVKVVTETAWHSLFTCCLLISPKETGVTYDQSKAWTLLHAPFLPADLEENGQRHEAAIILNFSQKRVLICGTQYAGEIKKAMFSVLNYLLPSVDVLPMHCAANQDDAGRVSLFFGLSGTGKTTLSADPAFALIGDDEHGWLSQGVFNFEGGCYAKCIDLSPQNEPTIHQAIRFGAVMENVVLDPVTRTPNFADGSLTQNTRVAYPRSHIENRVPSNQGKNPSAVIFLTCDLYGVLPPVARLTPAQAAYHFLSGYTALVGSTEVGQTAAIKPTFSTCFGAPFFPRSPSVYADLLMKRLKETNAPVYLVNTGWTGGPCGQGGKRFSIPTTRAIIHAIQSGTLATAPTTTLTAFNLQVPKTIAGVDANLLNPKNSWQDPTLYDKMEQELVNNFIENFTKFKVADEVVNAGPTVSTATAS